MKELEYPFDSEYIIKKRKSIKKTLLLENKNFLTKKIAILGGSTTNDIAVYLELFLLNQNIQPVFYQSEYGQYFQDAMFPPQELLDFQPDIIFIHTTSRNLLNLPKVSDTPEQVNTLLENEYQKFVQMWQKIENTHHCVIIQNNFELPFYRLMGNQDCADYRGRTNFINQLNLLFYDYAQKHENFYIHDINFLSASYGLKEWSNPLYWNLYKYAMCVNSIPEFSFNLANIIKSVFGKNKKALALDLDNTLWGGVVGDDGPENIAIGQETGLSQSYYEFQSYIKSLKSLGVVLTVCSKNEYENALAGLNHPEGIVKPEDFVVIKANWENKDRNLLETASELNILPEAIVFVDDNPAEREIVRSSLPKISVPEIDSVENYIITLDRGGYFEVTNFSEDDIKRTEMYQANVQRTALQASFGDYHEYLLNLDMQAIIDDFIPVYLQRITQLTNKSNQFNCTTKRYTQAEIEKIYQDPSYMKLYGKLTDKFGDNGVVSVVIGKKIENANILDIELWLMSCRVLKREMEFAMLDTLAEKCLSEGIAYLRGHYYPTAKNKMVRELYQNFGFQKVSEDQNGNTEWLLELKNYQKKCSTIKIKKN